MTKGLHKDSLQKIDNPHQWMIDDARMKLIQQIKAEMERRIKSWQTRGEHSPEGQGKDTCVSRVTELTDLLSFLSTLQEQPVDLDDVINNWQGIEAFPEGCGITPLPKAMEIVDKTARHFYALGQQSKGVEWTEKDKSILNNIVAYKYLNVDDLEWLKDIPNRIQQSKPEVRFPHEKDIVDKVFGAGNLDGWEYDEAKALVALAKEELLKDIKPEVSEGLEEEYKNYVENDPVYSKLVNGIVGLSIARHFAKWGAEHLKK